MKLETLIAATRPLVEGLVPNDENTGQEECTREGQKCTEKGRTCTNTEKYKK